MEKAKGLDKTALLRYNVNMNNTNEIISANLVKLRKSRKLTQAELAEQIHYSDKSISKWETGESCPSIPVALEIVKFYGITLDDLVNEELETEELPARNRSKKYSYLVITLLACSVVWLVATVSFVYGTLLSTPNPWFSYVVALPITCVVLLVFNSLWGNARLNYAIISVFTWSLLLDVFLYYLIFIGESAMWMIFILGLPVQVSIILWSQLKTRVQRVNAKNAKRTAGENDRVKTEKTEK